MKKVIAFLIMALVCTACHESIQERAQREAREFTERNCPTPESNGTITDSITYDPNTNVYTTYLTFTGNIDNEEVVKAKADEVRKNMRNNLMSDMQMRQYIDAGFNISFICRSQSDKGKILLRLDYKNSELK